jgi:2-C-methyl-D-erythritol 4-phosphate cytidylyltransferase
MAFLLEDLEASVAHHHRPRIDPEDPNRHHREECSASWHDLATLRAVKVSMLLLASGRSTRLGGSVPKPYLPCGGRPIVIRSIERLRLVAEDPEIVLAVNPEHREPFVTPLLPRLRELGVAAIVDGGESRQESMRRALAASSEDRPLVLIHDAARPFFPVSAAREALVRAAEVGAALLAVRSPDTLKRVGDDGRVRATVDRSEIWLAQTPQVLRRDRLTTALTIAERSGFVGTDDVSLCEHAGDTVAVVAGSRLNLKITTPDDLLLAECVARREDSR